jgi:hypothetical protein
MSAMAATWIGVGVVLVVLVLSRAMRGSRVRDDGSARGSDSSGSAWSGDGSSSTDCGDGGSDSGSCDGGGGDGGGD